MVTKTKIITKVNVGTAEETSYEYIIKYKYTDSESGEIRIETLGNYTIAEINAKISKYTVTKEDWEDNKDIAEDL